MSSEGKQDQPRVKVAEQCADSHTIPVSRETIEILNIISAKDSILCIVSKDFQLGN